MFDQVKHHIEHIIIVEQQKIPENESQRETTLSSDQT